MAELHLTTILRRLRTSAVVDYSSAVPDAQLVGQFAGGDEAAFALLLRRHGPMVLGLGRRLLGHEQDAEDVFQAAFLLLARKAGSIRKRQSVASWLHGVVYRLAGKARAQRVGRAACEGKAAAMRENEVRAGAAWRELYEMLHEVMDRLPERYRSALVLFHLEGRTHEEAAGQLGCPLSTFRSRLTRGRKLLHRELVARGVAPSAAAFTALLAAGASAAVPPAAFNTVLKAALPFASGQTAAGVSPAVRTLVECGLHTVTTKCVSMILAVVFAVGALGLGAAVLARSQAVGPPAAHLVVAVPAPAQAQPDSGNAAAPDLAGLAAKSDLILVGYCYLADPQQTAKELKFGEVTTFKGKLDDKLWLQRIAGMEPLPDTRPGTQWIFFLKTQTNAAGGVEHLPVAPKGWFLPRTPEWESKVKKTLASAKHSSKQAKDMGAARLRLLRQHLDTFHLGITLHPPQPQGQWNAKFPLRYLSLDVPLFPREPHANGPDGKAIAADTRIPEEQAAKLADALARDGYFDRALSPQDKAPATPKSFIEITVSHGGANPPVQYRLDYPWNKATLQLLRDLRAAVTGKAAELMDQQIKPFETDLTPPPQPADHPQPDPAGGITSWGKAVKGLQAGIRRPNDKKIAPEEVATFEIIVRNVSDEPILLKYLPVHFLGEEKNGTLLLHATYIGKGIPFTAHIHPGREMLLGMVTVGHVRPKLPTASYASYPELPPGQYKVGAAKVISPFPPDQVGWNLDTGYLDLELTTK